MIAQTSFVDGMRPSQAGYTTDLAHRDIQQPRRPSIAVATNHVPNRMPLHSNSRTQTPTPCPLEGLIPESSAPCMSVRGSPTVGICYEGGTRKRDPLPPNASVSWRDMEKFTWGTCQINHTLPPKVDCRITKKMDSIDGNNNNSRWNEATVQSSYRFGNKPKAHAAPLRYTNYAAFGLLCSIAGKQVRRRPCRACRSATS